MGPKRRVQDKTDFLWAIAESPHEKSNARRDLRPYRKTTSRRLPGIGKLGHREPNRERHRIRQVMRGAPVAYSIDRLDRQLDGVGCFNP